MIILNNKQLSEYLIKLIVSLQALHYTTNPGITIEIGLQMNGQALKQQIATLADLDIMRLKVICSGHVIEDDVALNQQHVCVSFY